MSFDPRSLERLRELGRQLPARLPEPEKPALAPKASQVRHRVETERNPEELFRELMKASQDGTVPEHLMDRLKTVGGPTQTIGSTIAVQQQRDHPSPCRTSAQPARTGKKHPAETAEGEPGQRGGKPLRGFRAAAARG